jgi:hypothetical protein
MRRIGLAGLILVALTRCQAQIVVDNPHGVSYPRDQVNVAYEVARRQFVEHLFPNQKFVLPAFPVNLKLGCTDPVSGSEYVDTSISRQDPASTPVVCLREWDLGKLTVGLIRIMQSRFLSDSTRQAIVGDVIHRVELSTPVSAANLRSRP